VRKSYLHSRV